MAALRLLQSLGWPVAAGLLIALLALLIFPDLRPAPVLDGRAQATPSPQSQALHSYADAVDRAAPAVVNIYTRKALEQRRHPLADHPLYRHLQRHLEQPQQRQQSALGSGVIVDTRGYLLTNEHVIRGAEDILVLLHDGRETRAQLVGTDPESDLAVLKIELDQLTAITVGEPSKARVGDIVLAIGNPFGVGQTVTQGIISATGRTQLGLSTFEDFIQTDAAINPGNSGGALITAHGDLIGINTAIFSRSGGSMGIGFAIPVQLAEQVLADIIEHGRVVRGWLGIEAQMITPQLAESFGLSSTDGVIIAGVLRNGPADRAGLKPADIVLRLNEEPVRDSQTLLRLITQRKPGEVLYIDGIRNGQEFQAKAIVTERPSTR